MSEIEERLLEIERRLSDIETFLKAKNHQYLLKIFIDSFIVTDDTVVRYLKEKIEKGEDINEGHLEYSLDKSVKTVVRNLGFVYKPEKYKYTTHVSTYGDEKIMYIKREDGWETQLCSIERWESAKEDFL